MGSLGFAGVRQVAIDDDWSALRFRRVEYIKKMARAENRRLLRKVVERNVEQGEVDADGRRIEGRHDPKEPKENPRTGAAGS